MEQRKPISKSCAKQKMQDTEPPAHRKRAKTSESSRTQDDQFQQMNGVESTYFRKA